MSNDSILVTGAHNLGHIAVIRSLGRAGYHVIACSEEPDALGFYSKYTNHYLQSPTYLDIDKYISWLNETIEAYHIKIIIPTEAFLIAIKDHFHQYQKMLPYDMDKELIYNLFSKYYLFHFFLTQKTSIDVKKNIPTCYFLNSSMDEAEVRSHIYNASFPLFLKADALYSLSKTEAQVSKVQKLDSLEDALINISSLITKYRYLLLQEEVSGVGVGVFFLRWNGMIIQYFMHQRLHEVPYTGGISSYRKSWWHEQIYKDALIKLESLNYNGVIMFEYRWDKKTDLFYLMEVNTRFWGSLHLALFAGVDFPKELVSCMLSENINEKTSPNPYPLNIRCRHTIPWDFQHMYSKIKDNSLSLGTKINAVIEFFYLMLNYTIKSDLLFKNDNYLYWVNLKRFIKSVFKPDKRGQ